jgi:RNase P protein component
MRRIVNSAIYNIRRKISKNMDFIIFPKAMGEQPKVAQIEIALERDLVRI